MPGSILTSTILLHSVHIVNLDVNLVHVHVELEYKSCQLQESLAVTLMHTLAAGAFWTSWCVIKVCPRIAQVRNVRDSIKVALDFVSPEVSYY